MILTRLLRDTYRGILFLVEQQAAESTTGSGSEFAKPLARIRILITIIRIRNTVKHIKR